MEATNEHYLKFKEIMKQASKKWYWNNTEKCKAYNIENTRIMREKLLNMLGGVCVCDGNNCWHNDKCQISDVRCIQLDHINGGGHQQHIKLGAGRAMYSYYLKNISLINKEIQILCANCNWVKRHNLKEACGKSK